ncbi:hypothetical protein C8J44_2258 [Sphingomonas sp. PP-CE-3A-406]|uniref:hypothetical protein n=1 Tax=Sphingomonas sp. PP-CE-3A-406 TaxID=2135659 RepID=UPI000F13E8C3|nr:hypothetical protein [Sphingomonas sp. PP-CE-3A-406]RMB54635.1 hypothetical protein C8J44_2258 [Sphingomonas sp. PP-CE-3A-406]
MSDVLDGLSLGKIPVAGTKRRSFGAQLNGQVYRIGRVWANRAFVVVQENLRLLYVHRDYGNYAAVARRVFDKDDVTYDYDHVLGRALCKQQGFDYILITRLDQTANRSHGSLERPQTAGQLAGKKFITLDKFCFADDRIFYKMLGVPYRNVPLRSRIPGYNLVKEHQRQVTPVQARLIRHALGMTHNRLNLSGLTPINR